MLLQKSFFATVFFYLFFLSSFSLNSNSLYALQSKVTIVALNDFHGELAPEVMTTKDGQKVSWGGAALLSRQIQILREQTKNPVLILDAGDLFQGTLISNELRGKPVVKFYNYLGVNAAAVGNHEFDYGPNDIDPSDTLGLLKDRIKEANFPLLAANIIENSGVQQQTIPLWTSPSLLIEKDGVKIGVVGAASESTATTTNPEYVKSLTFLHPTLYVVAEAKRLKKLGADYLILLIHEGVTCGDNNASATDWSSCSGELLTLLKEIPANTFDLVIGGHTHFAINKNYNGTPVVQNYPHGKDMLWVDLGTEKTPVVHGPMIICDKFIVKNGKSSCLPAAIRNYSGALQQAKFLGLDVTPDLEVEELLAADFKTVAPLEEKPLGIRIKKVFQRAYAEESALCNLITDLLFLSYQDRADVALMNNSGIRANIEEGALTYGAFYRVLPFDNRGAMLHVKGKTIRSILESSIARRSHSGLSWSHLTFKANDCDVTEILIDGKPLQLEQFYNIVTNDHLASGGSSLAGLKLDSDAGEKAEIFTTDAPIRDYSLPYLSKLGKAIHPADFFSSQSRRQMITGECNRH